MRVVLEGPDNSGKSSLAMRVRHGVERVDRAGSVTYFHPGGPPTDFDHEVRCITEQLKQLNAHRNIVMDRITPISQRVYNPDPVLDGIRTKSLQQYFELGIVVIYCRPSIDRLLRVQDFTWRDDETEEHKQRIISRAHEFIERYDQVMQTVPCISYDFEDRAMADVIANKMVLAMLDSKSDETWFHELINYGV